MRKNNNEQIQGIGCIEDRLRRYPRRNITEKTKLSEIIENTKHTEHSEHSKKANNRPG